MATNAEGIIIENMLGRRVVSAYNIVQEYHGRFRERSFLDWDDGYSLHRLKSRQIARYHGRVQDCSFIRAVGRVPGGRFFTSFASISVLRITFKR